MISVLYAEVSLPATTEPSRASRFAVFVASFACVGYFPVAPGTAGSLAALALFAIVQSQGSAFAMIAVTIVVLLLGTWSAGRAEAHFGVVDPGPVVIDEVAGMLISLALLPISVPVVFAGFILFRFFDIVKPWPARRLERLHGGVGVMADDAMCGIYANLAIRAGLWLLEGQHVHPQV
ncbi:MAG: phosphatidylglycerophosphatase A [Vicinamibacterales bacterium]